MNRLILLVESRIRGDVYVRFGGEHPKTHRSNTAGRWMLSLPWALEKKDMRHVKNMYEIIAYGLENLRKNSKTLTGIGIWFDDQGGLEGLNAKMLKDKHDKGEEDEVEYDGGFFDADFEFDPSLREGIGMINYEEEDDEEEEEESDYESMPFEAFSVISHALMRIHQDGRLKGIVGEYPFSVYVMEEDSETCKIFTIFNESGLVPAEGKAIEAYNQAVS